MAAVVQHPPQQMGAQPPLPPLYTRHDVMQHCEDDDCWIIVHDRVYDVTKFLIEVSVCWEGGMGEGGGGRKRTDRDVQHYLSVQFFSPFLFHTCHAYRHHCLLPFYAAFSDLDLGWRS